MIPHATIHARYQGPVLTDDVRRLDLEEGQFGAIAPYWCDQNNVPVWEEPRVVMTHKGCGFESFWGPEPDEYEWVCPSCGRIECVIENDTNHVFRATRRHTIQRHRHELAA